MIQMNRGLTSEKLPSSSRLTSEELSFTSKNNNTWSSLSSDGDSQSEFGEVASPSSHLQYACVSCDKYFSDSSNLQRHVRSVHQETSGIRHEGPGSTSSSGGGGGGSHICTDCGKAFGTLSGLKQHHHIHKSVKPFKCEVCFKAYTQFSNLCRHKRMHTDCRQNVSCLACGQTFSTTTSLSKHKRFCEGLFHRQASMDAGSGLSSRFRSFPVPPAGSDNVPSPPSKASIGCFPGFSSTPPFPIGFLPFLGQDPFALLARASAIAHPTPMHREPQSPNNKGRHSVQFGSGSRDDEAPEISDRRPSHADPAGEERHREKADAPLRDSKFSVEKTITVGKQNQAGTARKTFDFSDVESLATGDMKPLDLSCSQERGTPTFMEYQTSGGRIETFDSSNNGGNKDRGSRAQIAIDDPVEEPAAIRVPFDVDKKLGPSSGWEHQPTDFSIYHRSFPDYPRPIPQPAGFPVLYLGYYNNKHSPMEGIRVPPMFQRSYDSPFKASPFPSFAKERYSCRFCGKIFPRSANLTRHLRTHTGEQPYKCRYCERSFSISSNLQRHVRNIHKREKPFQCRLCTRSFGQQINLDRHLRKHEGDAEMDEDPEADEDVDGDRLDECCISSTKVFDSTPVIHAREKSSIERKPANRSMERLCDSASDVISTDKNVVSTSFGDVSQPLHLEDVSDDDTNDDDDDMEPRIESMHRVRREELGRFVLPMHDNNNLNDSDSCLSGMKMEATESKNGSIPASRAKCIANCIS